MRAQKGIAPILILLIILALAGGGYTAYKKIAAPPPSLSPVPTLETQTISPSPETAKPLLDMLQGFWRPLKFLYFDDAAGQFRDTTFTSRLYLEFKGSEICVESGGLDAQGAPIPCKRYAPFTIEGGEIVVDEPPSHGYRGSLTFSGDMLELDTKPLAAGPGGRTKWILARFIQTPPTRAPALSETPKTPLPASATSPRELITAADVSNACGGSFRDLSPPASSQKEYRQHFQRKEPYLELRINAKVLDLRTGAWDSDQFLLETKREPPYMVTERDFAGDSSIFMPDAGVGAKAIVKKGDYFVELEETFRICQTQGCVLPTCANGFVALMKLIVDRLTPEIFAAPSIAPSPNPYGY